jgi:hypothetical protein
MTEPATNLAAMPALREAAPLARAVTQPMTPMEMLSKAISDGANMDLLERLMSLQERYEAGHARKAFLEAKAAFKAEAPRIAKDKDNKQFNSKYASIGNVVGTVNPVLSKHGLDARWQIEQSDKGAVKVICILSHLLGHAESADMTAPPDTSGGDKAKNPIQQIKSTVTYLKLATYEAVTGIATEEGNKDDDGNAAGDATISAEQAAELEKLAEEVGANKAAFFNYAKIDSFSDILVKHFARAKRDLEAVRNRKAKVGEKPHA